MGRPEPQGQGEDKDPFTIFQPAVFKPDLRSTARIMLWPIGSPVPPRFTVTIDSVLVSTLPKRALGTVLAVAAPLYLIGGLAEISGGCSPRRPPPSSASCSRPWRRTRRSRCCGRTRTAGRSGAPYDQG